jgi:HlyD family secretion protein
MGMLFKNVRVIATLVIVGAIAAVALWPESIAVELVAVERGPMLVTIDEEGETRVRDRFVVSAPVMGRLQRIELEPGDAVAKGAIVATFVPADAPLLDPRVRAELTAAVDASRSGLMQATAERDRAAAILQLARDVLTRREQLVEGGLASREELDVARGDVSSGGSALRAAEAAVAQARFQVDFARARLQSPTPSGRAIGLRSPADGVLLKRMRESETVVQPGEPLVEIGNPAQNEIVSDLLSTDAVRVKPGDTVIIEQWGGGQTLNGRVRRVEPSGFMKVSALGVEEQRVNVIIDFADASAGRPLGDGYRVEVRIVTWRTEDAITTPVGSLFRHGDEWAVFVVSDRRAQLRPITLGHRNSDVGEILKGLQPGELVILHPPDTLTAGARVIARSRP